MTAQGSPEHVPIETLLAHREWVRALARSIYLDRNDADDLEQETWRVALERPPRHARSLRAWFASAVRHAAISAGRKARVRSAREAEALLRGVSPSPEESVAAAELQTKIAQAVLDLDEPYRTAVVLRFFDGLEATAIASRLSLPVETVRTRLKRAIERLRARMHVEVGDDRAAWSVLLFGVRAGKVKPLAPVAAKGSGAAALAGGLGMAAGTKLVAAAVVLVAGAAWWIAQRGETQQDRASVASVPAPDEGTSGTAPMKRATRSHTPLADESTETSANAAPSVPSEVPLGPDVVHGRVIDDETGAPVSKVVVSLVWEHVRRTGREPSATTAEDGKFRIPGAMDGTFGELLLRADGYAECIVDLPWRDQYVRLAKNDAGDVRIFRGRTISGRVVAADGVSPVAGASVRLSTSGGSSSLMWINDADERGTTDGSGEFVLERVPPSHRFPYTVFAVAKDGIGWTKLAGDAGRVEASGVQVALRPSGGATVTVRDEAGATFPGVEVVASPRFEPLGPRPEWDVGHDVFVSEPPSGSVFSANTDAQGVARFTALPTIDASSVYEFVVAVRATGARAWKASAVRARETATIDVVVGSMRMRTVAGLVRNTEGKPVTGAMVRIGQFNSPPTKTGADGRYSFMGYVPAWGEPTWIEVTAAGFARVERSIKPDPQKDVLAVDIDLKLAGPISGRVVDQDGKPVAGATLSTARDDASINGRNVTTDAEGRFVFTDTAAGEWRLTLSPPAPEDEWEFMPQAIVHGGDHDVVLVQRRAAPGTTRLVIAVVDDVGAPLAPDEIWSDGAEESASHPYATHGNVQLGNGRAVVERMKPGRWNMWLHFPDRLGALVLIDVAAGQTEMALRVVVGRPGVIRGRVDLGDSGATMPTMVMPDLEVTWSLPQWARPHGPKMVGAARVAADGTFEFPEVIPGRWRIFTPTGDFVGEGFADVPAGGEGTCIVRMTQTGTVSLRLAAASPSRSVECWFGRDGAPLRRWASRSVSANGSTALESKLPPGRWRWRVSFPSDGSWGLVRVVAETQEGDVLVTAGQTALIDVAVVPK